MAALAAATACGSASVALTAAETSGFVANVGGRDRPRGAPPRHAFAGFRAARADAHDRAARAAGAVPADPQGGLHQHPLAAGEHGRPRRAGLRPLRHARGLAGADGPRRHAVEPAEPLLGVLRGRAGGDARGRRLAALHDRPPSGDAAVVGVAVQAAAARATLRADLRRGAVVPRAARRRRSRSSRDFRRFVAAVGEGGVEDVHWAVQHELERQLSFTHIGKVEQMPETLAVLREHVGDEQWPEKAQRENRTPLSLPPAAYDEAAEAVLRERYAADFETFDYAPEDHLGARRGGAGRVGREGLAAPADPALERGGQRARRAAARPRARAAQARALGGGRLHRARPAADRRHPRARR